MRDRYTSSVAHQITLKDVVPCLGKIDQSAAGKIHHLLGLIQQAEQTGDIFEESYSGHRKDTDARTYPRRERPRSAADTVQILRSSVDCLMRLLPTMEKTLAFA